jgi:hypothetical protein
MEIIRVKFSDRQSGRTVQADVDRCVRHRGERSLNNYFIIGRDKDSPVRYRVYVRPFSLVTQWEWQSQLEIDHMIKWADGTLTSQHMTFYYCDAPDADIMIPSVLALAFNSSSADERLEDFYEAKIRLPFFSHETSHYTIGSVIGINRKF